MKASYVYRLYDASGRLLYVGKADDVAGRLNDHRLRAWWPEVATATQEQFNTSAEAFQAEDRAIALERPKYNMAGSVAGVAPAKRLRRHGIQEVDIEARREKREKMAEAETIAMPFRAAYGQTEAAQLLGVTRQHLANMERLGQLRVVRLGRRVLIPADEINRLMGVVQ